MLSKLKLQTADFFSLTSIYRAFPTTTTTNICPPRRSHTLHHPPLHRFASPSVRSDYGSASPSSSSEPSLSTHYISSAGSSSLRLSQWTPTNRHILVLNVFGCAVAVSATWLFFSASPTILAFKSAAESLEKLRDVTREELPDTMAAVRLSSMEISDLTMQDITQSVRSSTRAVRIAEERLRGLSDIASSASVQVVANQTTDVSGPALARKARSIREAIVKGRALFLVLFYSYPIF